MIINFLKIIFLIGVFFIVLLPIAVRVFITQINEYINKQLELRINHIQNKENMKIRK